MKEKFGQPTKVEFEETPVEVEPEEAPVEETTEELKARLERETGKPIKRIIGKEERRRDDARARQAFKDFRTGQGELPLN